MGVFLALLPLSVSSHLFRFPSEHANKGESLGAEGEESVEISVKGNVTWGEKYFLFHWLVCVCVCVCTRCFTVCTGQYIILCVCVSVCVHDALLSVRGRVLSCVCVRVSVCARDALPSVRGCVLSCVSVCLCVHVMLCCLYEAVYYPVYPSSG